MVDVLHIGPDVYTVGGTQSVMRTLRDLSIGADRAAVAPTWMGGNHLDNLRHEVRAAREIWRSPRSRVMHFHMSGGGAWLREPPLMRLARGRGHRVIVTLHGPDFPDFSRKHPHYVGRVLRSAAHVVCLADDAMSEVKRHVGSARASIVPNPMPIDLGSPSAAETRPVALFAGTIEMRKGVDVLIAAWRSLVERGIPGECRLVGPVLDYTPPEVAGLTVEPAVHPSKVGALIRDARVVVLPSRAEAMPMILTEALAAGRPFIATPVGGVPTITPDSTMLVPVGDSRALADAIERFLMNPDVAADAGTRGQAYIARTRSPEVVGIRLREIYES